MNKKVNKWSLKDIEKLYHMPFNDLIYQAQTVHRQNHDPNKIQVSTLMSIKTGGCPEDCKYCSQSIKYNTDVEIEKLLTVDEVIAQAKEAKKSGASRFCMGAAWRNLNDSNISKIKDMVKAVMAAAPFGTALFLSGCNTVQGLGEDVVVVGGAIKDAATRDEHAN